jgi:signal transduction histidine kinase/ligand-binding sensor domain-containing protein
MGWTGLWLGAVLLGGWSTWGEEKTTEPSSSPPTWEVSPTEGGSPTPVTALAQSQEGYLWAGTYHGLLRFDGVHIKVFDAVTAGLANGLITALYEGTDGVLWIGHETGQLTRYECGKFQQVELPKTWKGGAIEGITSDGDGDLWLMSDAGVFFRLRGGLPVEPPGGPAPRQVFWATADDGRIFVVANGTVATLDHGQWTPFQFPDSQANDYYDHVLPSRDGGLWVLGNGRLRKWDQGRWIPEPELSPNPGPVTTLMETRSGVLLIGTLHSGLYLVPPGNEPQHFSHTNGLSHDWVRSLYEDHEGNLWVGSSGGLDRLRPRKVEMLDPPDNWRGYAVQSFCFARDGSAWIGTEGAGLYQYDHGQWRTFGQTNGLLNPFVWSVLETPGGDLFVGTFGGGLFMRNGDRFESPGDLAKITEPVLSLYSGRHGELWIGTRRGLHRYEGGKLVWSAGTDKLFLPDVRAITETPNGQLCFGMHGGGLGLLKDGTLKQIRKADGMGSDYVVCLTADTDGTLWIGTSDNGLIRLKKGRFVVINSERGLPSNIIYHIVDDGADNLWLGSEAGIWRVNKADLHRCADGLTRKVRTLNYGKAEGLASLSCSGGYQPGARKGTDGRLCFPTTKGLALINPVNVTTNTARPPVVIEEVLVNSEPLAPAIWSSAPGWYDGGDCSASGRRPAANQPTESSSPRRARAASNGRGGAPPAGQGESLQLPPGSYRVEFQFAGLSFASPDRVRFRFNLEGLSPEWREVTSRSFEYSYLPPGSYTFRVRACNSDEVWNDEGASLAFTVLPFFWQTWWFQASALVACGGLGGAGLLWVARRRVRRRVEQLERQRALERERARIARDIHDDLGASLTRITMLSQSVRGELDGQPQAAADADQIYSTARELTRAMDEIVWAVNPKHDTLDSLVTYLGRFAQHFLSAAGIRCRLDVPVHLPDWTLTAETRHNVFLAFKEALHNVIKHAAATEVRVSLELQSRGFTLLIADNGRGFAPELLGGRTGAPEGLRLAAGNGLVNMRKRLEEIGGRCEVDTAVGEGTRVKLSVIKTHDTPLSVT